MRPRSDGTLSSCAGARDRRRWPSRSRHLRSTGCRRRRRPARRFGMRSRDLLAQIALDQRRRHQHGEAKPQRQHDDAASARRAGAGWPAPAAGRRTWACRPAPRPHQRRGQQREGDEGADRAQHEPGGDARLSAVKTVKPASATAAAPISAQSRQRQPAAGGDHRAAHQGRGRHARGRASAAAGRTSARPAGRTPPAVASGADIERHPRAHRQQLGDQRLGQERQRGADRPGRSRRPAAQARRAG